MNSGLYAACAGLLARTQALEVAANNLANVNTNGYKAQLPSFHSVLASANGSVSGNELREAVNNFGVLGESRTNLAQGNLEHTGSDLDFAIQGEGWFAVQSGARPSVYAERQLSCRSQWPPGHRRRRSSRGRAKVPS